MGPEGGGRLRSSSASGKREVDSLEEIPWGEEIRDIFRKNVSLVWVKHRAQVSKGRQSFKGSLHIQF